jgi:hypothetical protein
MTPVLRRIRLEIRARARLTKRATGCLADEVARLVVSRDALVVLVVTIAVTLITLLIPPGGE